MYLRRLRAPDDAERLLALDAVLEAAELLLLRPVVEGRHQHDDDDRDEDGGALDPRRVLVLLGCSGQSGAVSWFKQKWRKELYISVLRAFFVEFCDCRPCLFCNLLREIPNASQETNELISGFDSL